MKDEQAKLEGVKPLTSSETTPAAAEQEPHAPRHPGRDPSVSVFAESDTELIHAGRKFVVVGFTHRTAPLAVRSRFAVAKADFPVLARQFKALPGVEGCVVVATCNRVPISFFGKTGGVVPLPDDVLAEIRKLVQ